MIKLIFTTLIVVLFTSPVFAEAPQGTVVNLSAEATMEVANDEVAIHFRVEERGKKLSALRKRVNQMTATIKKSLATEKGVKLKTSSRRVDPIWKPNQYNRVRDGWVVVQTGVVTSQKLDEVPRWLDIIEKAGAKLQNLSFRISDAVRRDTQEKLRLQAIAQFRKKAELVTKALAGKSFVIKHLNTGASYSPQPMYRGEMAMMSKSMVAGDAAPSLSSGDSRISVSVNGGIEVEQVTFKVD